MKLYHHLIWATKYRKPILNNPHLRKLVWTHIQDNALKHNIPLYAVSGFTDHCHCLVEFTDKLQKPQISHILKGESSRWINRNNLTQFHFSWQVGCFDIYVHPNKFQRVKRYIEEQELKHQKMNFGEEIKIFLNAANRKS